MAPLYGLFGAVASMIRWAEPWDIELDDDPLLMDEADLLG